MKALKSITLLALIASLNCHAKEVCYSQDRKPTLGVDYKLDLHHDIKLSRVDNQSDLYSTTIEFENPEAQGYFLCNVEYNAGENTASETKTITKETERVLKNLVIFTKIKKTRDYLPNHPTNIESVSTTIFFSLYPKGEEHEENAIKFACRSQNRENLKEHKKDGVTFSDIGKFYKDKALETLFNGSYFIPTPECQEELETIEKINYDYEEKEGAKPRTIAL
jgi:hypothetical protein